MKKTIIKYGLYAVLLIVVVPSASWMILGSGTESYTTQAIVGYASIVLSTFFIFLGVKYYRDNENLGKLSFGQGLKLGLLIGLFPAVAFGLLDRVYVAYVDPDFYDKYAAMQLEEMKASMSTVDFEIAAEKVKTDLETFSNPVMAFLLMFATVYVIGLIVSILSGLILKTKDSNIQTS